MGRHAAQLPAILSIETVGGTLAGLCPDVPEEYPLNLPCRLARELVESVPQFVIVRGVRAEHHYPVRSGSQIRAPFPVYAAAPAPGPSDRPVVLPAQWPPD